MTTNAAIPAAAPATGREPSAGKPPASSRRSLNQLPAQIVVFICLLLVVLPLLWLVIGSFKTQEEWLNGSPWSLPSQLEWSNYSEAWTTGKLDTYVRNSTIAVIPSLFLIILLGTAAGFALEVLVWKGRNTVLLLFLLGIMVPGQMILLPLFTAYFQTGLTGTLWPLIITYTGTGLPLTVFMMATYFRAVPREIFEAATLDGASMVKAFLKIGFPMVRNAVLTVGLVQFFFIWNDLLIALTFTTSSDLRTIQVGLLNFTGEFGQVQYGPLFAGICINVFGILLLYLFANQKVMAGLAGGAVKG
jgi:raffinose/stachyose/melibiose transport system permease protein